MKLYGNCCILQKKIGWYPTPCNFWESPPDTSHPKAGSFLLFLPLRGAWLPGCRGPIGPGASRGRKLSETWNQMGWLVTT